MHFAMINRHTGELNLRALSVMLLAITFLLCSMMIVFAEDENTSGLTIYNTRIITNNTDATYIEGEVADANGQEIVVTNAYYTPIARKALPATGQRETFRIKIPGDKVSKRVMSVFFIKTVDQDGSSSDKRRIEVSYEPRKEQEVKVSRKKFDMTLPGTDEPINASSTSGEGLIYKSSDPDVATVNASGDIVATGAGNATITIEQIGNDKYDRAEQAVDVSVKAIDAYSVTFHESYEGKATEKQIINTGTEAALEECSFENGEHKFLGWATEKGGLVKYDDAEEVEDLAKKGENMDLYAVWTGDGAPAAVAWAIDIANDDSFTYGDKPAANAIGCYFCGTNCGPVRYNKPSGYEKTYVCLTFVAAAYAHGAEDPEIYYACSHGKMPLYENDDNFSRFSCWTKIGRCSQLSIDDLKPGDVVIKWSDQNDNNGHTWIYAGDDQIVESTGGGWGAGSIALKGGASDRLAEYGNSSINFVMRYTGPNALDYDN